MNHELEYEALSSSIKEDGVREIHDVKLLGVSLVFASLSLPESLELAEENFEKGARKRDAFNE